MWKFLGADQDGIYIQLIKDEQNIKISLPPTQDYFEQDEETGETTSQYLEENFDDLWDMHTLDGVKKLKQENNELRQLLADLTEEVLLSG